MLDFAEAKLDVSKPCLGAIQSGFFEHRGGHVDANYPASWSDLARGKKSSLAGFLTAASACLDLKFSAPTRWPVLAVPHTRWTAQVANVTLSEPGPPGDGFAP